MSDTASTPVEARTMEQVVIGGDLALLTPAERLAYYKRVCESLGLNPFTRPFQYIEIWDKKTKKTKLTLYATKDATEQLRQLHGISIVQITRETLDEVHMVTANALDAKGRTDSATGAVPLRGLEGDDLSNAFMRAETKAKRRVTLSLAGLGWLDESETSSIQSATLVEVDTETGEIALGAHQRERRTDWLDEEARSTLDAAQATLAKAKGESE